MERATNSFNKCNKMLKIDKSGSRVLRSYLVFVSISTELVSLNQE